MSFETILSSLLESPGALGAAFLDPQGEVIARAGDEAATEVLGAYQSVWLAELTRAADRAGLGSISELALDFEGRKVLTAPVKAGFFLLVVLSPEGRPSVVRGRMEESRDLLAAEVS
ncbi:MAG: roadblock/LC7 domain-containing protein [Thermoanaerobaculia bacterium]